MNNTLTDQEMFEELMRDYDEGYHDDDSYNPEGYGDYLESLTDDEFELLYLERFSAC
jgi:hypothetical protein